MRSRAVTDTFKKLMQICHKNHILKVRKLDDSNNFASVQFGTLGSLLKRNIFNEWLCSLLNNSEINVFPLEISNTRKITSLSQRRLDKDSDCLLSDVIGNYYETVCTFGQSLPIGFAVYGSCMNKNIVRKEYLPDSDLNILSDLQAWTRLSVIFLCPTKKSMNWFYYWSKQRYLWWRKYSSIPSKFSMSDVTTTPFGDQELSLMLEFPWGKHKIETITMYGNKYVGELCVKHNHSQDSAAFDQVVVPAVVACETELEIAVLAYLTNSFAVKWRGGETKNIFHLHYKLAPYKVCLSLEETDAEKLNKLKTVASHLTKELKETGISVFPTSELFTPTKVPSKFERFDEMGLPYIIVLNENSLQTGIAGLRNRDTTLQEQIHITELTAKLVKYLKIKG